MAGNLGKRFGVTVNADANIGLNTVNFDNFPASTISSLESKYVQLIMTNTITNTAYMSADALADVSLDLHTKMFAADPEFMAKALVYARDNGLMRTQPIIGLAILTNESYTTGALTLSKKIFGRIIKTPGDLIDFITMLPSVRKSGKGIGLGVKKMVGAWLNNMSEYHAIKYGAEPALKLKCSHCSKTFDIKKERSERCPGCLSRNSLQIQTQWGLRDILKVTRPLPITDKQNSLFAYLMKSDKYTPSMRLLPQIDKLEELKLLAKRLAGKEITEEEYTVYAVKAIEAGKLPYEIVSGIVSPTTAIWEYLMHQMPMRALMSNLNTLQRHGVLDKQENVNYVVSRLTNESALEKAMLWPSTVVTAYQYVEHLRLKEALRSCVEISFRSVQPIPGKNAIFLDVSGSMNEDRQKNKKNGAVLGLAALRNSSDSIFMCFDTSIYSSGVSPHDSIATNFDRVMHVGGGGTNIGRCLDYMMGSPLTTYGWDSPTSIKATSPTLVDNIIILTDEQQNSGTPLIRKFREYRTKVNKKAKLFIIDVAPYESRIAPEDTPGVYFIFGWSASVLKYINSVLEGVGGQIEYIKNMTI